MVRNLSWVAFAVGVQFASTASGQAFSPPSAEPAKPPFIATNENTDFYRMKARASAERGVTHSGTQGEHESVRIDAPVKGDVVIVINPKLKR